MHSLRYMCKTGGRYYVRGKCRMYNAKCKFCVIARALAPVAISDLNIMQIVTTELRLIY